MSCALQEYFEDLSKAVTAQKTSNAKISLINIINYFDDELSGADIDLAISAIFNNNNGIVVFLKANLQHKQFKDSIYLSYKLFLLLLEQFKTRLHHYVQDIAKVCISCLYTDTISKEKAEAVEVLFNIITVGPWSQLDVPWLVKKLIHQLDIGKQKGRVLSKLYPLLGLLAKEYPFLMTPHAQRLQSTFFSAFEFQTVQIVTTNFLVVCGALQGLCHLYCTFSPDPDIDTHTCKRLYTSVKTMSDPGDMKSRPAFRAALELLVMHSNLIAGYLYRDYLFWHNLLLRWLHLPWEDRKAGIAAMESFHKEIANVLKIKGDRAIFQFFISYFTKTMQSQTAEPHELRLAIRGFGSFANSCKMLMSEQDVVSLFTLVMQRTEQIYLIDSPDKDVYYLPDYIYSLSLIIGEIAKIDNQQMNSLQQLTVMLIKEFPKVTQPCHISAINALTSTFVHVSKLRGTIFDDMLQKTVYQGVIWSCSHQILVDSVLAKDDASQINRNDTTYKSYLPLWLGLLDSKRNAMISAKVYDELVKSLISLINKLDLNTKKKVSKDDADESLSFCDPNAGLEATTPKDFQIFINIVDLFKELLVLNKVGFTKWIQPFCYEIISNSYRHPLVSGFYKLLALGLEICDSIDYFTEPVESMTDDKKACTVLISRFLQDCLCRLQQYTGDLQVSCLQTILAAPTWFVIDLLHGAFSAFQVIFKVGRSYLRLAHIGLTTLERWNGSLPKETIKPLLRTVLPYLDPFLQSHGFPGDPDVKIELLHDVKKRRRRPKKRLVEGTPSELAQLQRRILKFIGQLEPSTCLSLLTPTEDLELVAWDTDQYLKFRLPCIEMKPIIHLDGLLPRVTTLALESSDRRTRVAACEVLHGIIVFMLGTGVQVDSSRLHKLYSNIFPELLQLASDSDTVVMQLFDPLLLQLSHWLSSKWKLRSKESALFITVLMDGISHTSDSAVRDVSSKYLREFVKWSFKQSTPEELEHSPVNIKAIVNIIISYSLHPSYYKRFGAALAFNNLYAVLRESDAIVDQFWLELLHCFVTNLMLKDDTSLEITMYADQIIKSLNHIEKVFKMKCGLFNDASEKRRKPPGFEGAALKDIVLWILKQCGSVQPDTRHKCMEMYCTLAPVVYGCTNSQNFMDNVISTYGIDAVINIAEGTPNGSRISSRFDLSDIIDNNNLDTVMLWMKHVLAALDFYVWIFEQKICTPLMLLNETSSKLIISIDYFIRNVCKLSVEDVVSEAFLTPKEKEQFYTLKCTVIVRTFDLISVIVSYTVLNKLSRDLIIQNLWHIKLFSLITICIFKPQEIGFDLRNLEITQKLPNLMENLLHTLKKHLLHENWLELVLYMIKSFDEYFINICDYLQTLFTVANVSIQNYNYLKGINLIVKLPDFCENSTQMLHTGTAELITNIFDGLVVEKLNDKYTLAIPPNTLLHLELFLTLSCNLWELKSTVISLILNDTIVKNLISGAELYHGDYFLAMFKGPLFDYFLKTPEDIVNLVVNILNENTPPHKCTRTINVIIELLVYVYRCKSKQKMTISSLLSSILSNWEHITKFCGDREIIELISRMAMVTSQPMHTFGTRAKGLDKWCIDLLKSDKTLDFKTRVLQILPCITGTEDTANNELFNALKEIQEKHFPLDSNEFPVGSMERAGYVSAVGAILDSMSVSGSPVIFERVIAIMAGDSNHICEDYLQKNLKQLMRGLSTLSERIRILTIALNFTKDYDLSHSIRFSIIKRFLIPMIQATNVNAIEVFYTEQIHIIKELANKQISSSTKKWELLHVYTDKICGFSLIELLVFSLKPDRLVDIRCPILQKFMGNELKTGKEMMTEFSRISFKARVDVNLMPHDTECSELFRLYQCSAYKALCAIISNTRYDIKFYNGLLFGENKIKREFLWRNIIDCSKVYVFQQDFDEIPKRKKQLILIRQSAQTSGQPPLYFESHSIFTSTLSQDITKLDFTHAVVRSERPNELESNTVTPTEIYLFEDALNSHECMAVVCGVIGHMVNTGISPLPAEIIDLQGDPSPARNIPPMPPWMKSIHEVLLNKDNHTNCRLFLAKVIDNCQAVFKPYSAHFFEPLFMIILDGCAGDTLNCFIIDLIAMMLTWNDVAIPSNNPLQRSLASELLEFLIKNANHESTQIYKFNIQLIKNVVEIWNSCLDLPLQLMYDKIKTYSTNTKVNETGLQLAAIVLANDLEPWSHSTRTQFFKMLLMNLNNSQRLIFEPTTEVIGMSLNRLKLERNIDLKSSDEEYLLQGVTNKLEQLKKAQSDLFIKCLYGIHKHYPEIADQYIVYILNKITSALELMKAICLHILLSRLETLGDQLPLDIMTLNFTELLKEKEMQHLGLHVINKLLPLLEYNLDKLSLIIENVWQFGTSKSTVCRDIMYEIAMWAYDKLLNNNNPTAKAIFEKAITTLLNGLTDNDEQLQSRVLKFWMTNDRLPSQLQDLFLSMLSHLYNTLTEENYLGYSMQIVLQNVLSSPDCERKIFEHPLTECKFYNYKVTDSWRAQHASIAPLFAETLAGQIMHRQQKDDNLKKPIFIGSQMPTYQSTTDTNIQMPVVRATVNDLFFDPTQTSDQSDIEPQTFRPETFSIRTYSSLLFDTRVGQLDRRTYKPVKDVPTPSVLVQTNKFDHLRRRFLRDKDRVSRGFAAKEISRREQRTKLKVEQYHMRESHVTMYRQYRIGDFPDIEITSTSIVKPLQVLAKRDNHIARQLFISLFSGISFELPAENASNFVVTASSHIQNILTNSQQCNPAVMATMFEVALEKSENMALNPETVCLVAHTSRLLPLGALLLEQRLLGDLGEQDGPSGSKRVAGGTDNETMHWLKIAELYQSMSEWDVTNGIFSNKMSAGLDIYEGLKLEAEREYIKAQYHYQSIIKGSCSPGERDFCYESYYKCFAYLGEWESLNKTIKQQIEPSINQIWDDVWYQDKVLPWLMTSEIHTILDDKNNADIFLNIVESWMKDQDKNNHLKVNFSEELAMLYVIHKNYHSAKYHSEQSVTLFLEEWSNLSPLSVKLRSNRILSSQKSNEIQMFLQTVSFNDRLSYAGAVHNLVNRWSNSLPNLNDSLLLWETRIAYRRKFADLFKEELRKEDSEGSDYTFLMNIIDNCKIDMDLALLEVSIEQKNIGLARKYVRRQQGLLNNPDFRRNMRWKLARSRQVYLQTQIESNLTVRKKDCQRSWEMLEKLLDIPNVTSYLDIYLEILQSISSVTQTLCHLFESNVELVDDSTMAFISKWLDAPVNSNPENVVDLVKYHSFQKLSSAVEIVEKTYNEILANSSNLNNDNKNLQDTYMKLANFCQDNIKNCPPDVKSVYENTLVPCILKAMSLGSKDARQLFPVLLQIKTISTTLKDCFIELSTAVPEWMFIQWAPQLLARLDGSSSAVIGPILHRVAVSYPGALQYPFRLSLEKYKYEQGSYVERIINELRVLLMSNPLIDDFLAAFNCLCLPSTLLNDCIDKLRKLMATPIQRDEWDRACEEIRNTLFSEQSNAMRGNAFQILKQFERGFKHLMANPNKDNLGELVANIKKKCTDRFTLLKDFCPWLANFSRAGTDFDLELPGQYDGLSKPNLQSHVKIVSFDKTVTVLQSLRLPIRIGILGNDAKEHIYLIKHGEDLRQDQRIQQLFGLMNDLLSNDPACKLRNLSIETYQVIPLTTNVGLIQWVSHTEKLRDVLSSHLDEATKNTVSDIVSQYVNWLMQASSAKDQHIMAHYGNACVKYNRNMVIAKFREFVNTVPFDLLRMPIQKISVSPESFFALRHNFATSYAAMCIAHWILGIGDRHLSNCLVSMKTGRVYGIDFGHAFGSATLILPVPEIMPFRMTPCILHMMEPTAEFGLLPMTMIHTLKCLRSARSILLATMDVFVQEPLMDWLGHIRGHTERAEQQPSDGYPIVGSSQSIDYSIPTMTDKWTPQLKITMAHRKLTGSNPIRITKDELKGGVIGQPENARYLQAYIKVLEGEHQHNVRARLPDRGLSPEDQVKCLFDLATDYNILGRTFAGWQPWM